MERGRKENTLPEEVLKIIKAELSGMNRQWRARTLARLPQKGQVLVSNSRHGYLVDVEDVRRSKCWEIPEEEKVCIHEGRRVLFVKDL